VTRQIDSADIVLAHRVARQPLLNRIDGLAAAC
jgi:hypothetical protein